MDRKFNKPEVDIPGPLQYLTHEQERKSAKFKHGYNCIIQPPSQKAHEFVNWCREVGRRLVRHNLHDIDMVPFITENGDLLLAFDVDEIRAPLVQKAALGDTQ